MNTPSLNSVTVLVDLELKRLEDSRREQGWTPWILLAALAALCWQLADYLAVPQRWEDVGLYWALLVVVGMTIEGVISALNAGDAPRRQGMRYFRTSILSSGRSVRLFAALKIGSAAALLCWLAPLAGPFKFAWLALFGFYVYALVGYVAWSWVDILHPVGTAQSKKKYAWVLPAVFWMLHIGLVIAAVWQLWPRVIGSYDAANARLALLGFAVVHLISLLLGFGVNEPIRRELIHLRRQIGFGELDAGQAQQKLFELLYGSELSVLLRSRFEEVEKALHDFPPHHDKAVAALLAASERGRSLGEVKELIKQAEDRFDTIENAWIALQIRLMICRFSGGMPDDVAALGTAFKIRVETDREKVKALKSGWKNLPRWQSIHE